ncbi:MAG: hypothetical protein PHQ62_03330 [Clostridia bacterium]|nr:hypothetical protein [Clostridia bacterium]
MKKIRNMAFLLSCMLVAVLVCGCNQQTLTASFNERTIQIEMGQEYDPYSFIDEEIDAGTKSHITFKSGNNQVAFVTTKNKLVAVSTGSTALFCYYDNAQFAYCFVEVVETPIQLNAPVNVKFDTSTNCITWNYVYAQGASGLVVAGTYTVEITKNNGTPVEYQAIGNTYGLLNGFGNYKIRVKTNSAGNFLASDYGKNANDEYKVLEFNLMGTPNNLSYNKTTEMFSWSANGNPENTKYKVYVNGSNIADVNGTTETSISIPTSVAGTYSVYVEAVPLENYILAKSKTVSLIQLASPVLSFENGILSWNSITSATSYKITLKNNGVVIGDPIITTNPQVDLSAVAVGEYVAEVQAIGDSTKYIFDSIKNTYIFEKIGTAQLQLDLATNTFSVLNNSGYTCKIYITNQTTQEQTIIENTIFEWNITDFDIYTITVKFFASNASNQIDGNFSAGFVLNDESSTVLTKIQNLQNVNLAYSENNGNSFINFNELNENSNYSLWLDGVNLDLERINNQFELGETNSLFTNSEKYYFELKISKEIENSTIFVGVSSQMAVEKLPSPMLLSLSGNTVIIADTNLNNFAISSTKFVINDIVTNTLNMSNMSNSAWDIKANFVAIPGSLDIGNTKTYFTSSNVSNFYLRRLSNIENLAYNYQTNTISWNAVQNASLYHIYIDGQKIDTTTSTQYYFETVGNKVCRIVAEPNSWQFVSTNQTGYLQSFTSAPLTIFQANAMTDLTLDLDNGIVSANWVAPTNTASLVLTYDIFVDDIAIIQNVSGTTYTFDSSLFENANTYKISVKMTCPNNNYFLPIENEISVNLTRLSAPETLNKNANFLSAVGFNASIMNGLSFNQIAYSENNYEIPNIDDGESIVLSAYYLGKFDSDQSVYYLNSQPAIFTLQKLNVPQNLHYEDNTVFWDTLDTNFVGEFVYNYCINVGLTTTEPAITDQTQVDDLYYETEFAFVVFEQLSSIWTSISANQTKLLPSTNVASLYVVKENTVSNLEMQLTPQKDIKILWNYSQRLTDVEDYRTNFAITLEAPNNFTYTITQPQGDTLFENGKYFYVFDSTDFELSTTYVVSVKAISNKTLNSISQFINITKLSSVNHIGLWETNARLVDNNLQPINLNGVLNVVVSGSTTTINGLNIDLSAMTSGENWTVFVKLIAIMPQSCINGNYFLDSDTTEYKFVKILNLSPAIDLENNRITWIARENATSYSLKVEKPDGTFAYIENITNNYLSLNDSRLLQITANSGYYQISVKANVIGATLTPFVEANNSPIGFICSDYASSVIINKLDQIFAPTITTVAEDLTQTQVTITWNTVANATSYDVFVSGSRGVLGTLLTTINTNLSNPTLSYTTDTAFVNTGNYFVGIVARANGNITSSISEQVKVVRLDSITSGYVDKNSYLSWVETNQIATMLYDHSYYFATFDNNDQFVEEFGTSTQILQNFYSLANNVWLETLNGQSFKIKIRVLGNGVSNGSEVATLSSNIFEIEAYKFLTPSISIQNNTINITSDENESLVGKLKYVYSIQSGDEIKIENATYTGAFEIPQSWQENGFTVTTYATTNADIETNNNLLKSNVATMDIERLAQATGLVVGASDPLDTTQKYVDIFWNAVPNATSYDIFVNNVYKATVNAGVLDTDFTFTTQSLFANSGSYQVKILAKATGYINSLFSEIVTVVRLNPITYGYMNVDKIVNWTNASQLNPSYTYYLELLSESGSGYQVEGQSLTNLTELTYADFATNEWLDNFEGGNFAIKIIVFGNGSSNNENKVATLSSADYNLVVLKLFNPQITINPNYMTLSFAEANFVVGSGTIATNAQNIFSVWIGEQFAKYGSNLDIDNIVYNQETGFYYPDNWAEGVYTFKAYSKPIPNSNNIISSNIEEVTTTRLSAPTSLKFYREALTDTSNYSNDNNLLSENYLSDKIYFSFSNVENCSTYNLANGNQSCLSSSNTILVNDQFENILNQNSGLKILKVTAIGTGGSYINSAPSEIAFYKLSRINIFETQNGQVKWNLQENVSNYLIKNIDSVSSITRFWQSENGAISTSILTGILDTMISGQLALNIKALGNITATSDGSGTIILDSSYLTNSLSFYKLNTTDNLKTYLGYLAFNKIANAETYVAKIFSSENVLLRTITLEDYSVQLQYPESTTSFVGYSDLLYELEKETLYKIKIQAQSTTPLTIYSDLSNAINIKILENANPLSSNVSLMKNPNGDLTKTLILAFASQNSYGLLGKSNNRITVSYQEETPYSMATLITMPTNVVQGGIDIIYTFASLGSSSIEEGDFYYLSSTFTSSSDIHILQKANIWVENGTIFWTEIENADGYYIYLGENLYQTAIYTETHLDLTDLVFEASNNLINISIVGVSNDLSYLYSPKANYQFEYFVYGNPSFENINLYKNIKPIQFSIVDGALVWDLGISSLDSLDPGYFYNLINFVSQNPTKENLQTLQNFLIQNFLEPVLCYSEYLGFTNPELLLTFENILTGIKYNVETTAGKFLKLSNIQQENLFAIKSICLSFAEEMLQSLTPSTPKDLFANEYVLFANQNDFWYSYFTNFKSIFESDALTDIINLYEEEIVGWPNIETLFGELNSQTLSIPAGKYKLTIVQKGNNLDWLNSSPSLEKSIYIPNAVNGIEIKENNGDYLLYWNEVFIPAEYNYSPLTQKYIIYGEDLDKNRYELLRTDGTAGVSQNSLYYNLSELVNNGILGTNIVKIFIAVAGDNVSVVRGLKSIDLSVVILPQVAPYMENGYLSWNSLISASEYEIFASAEGFQDLLVRTNNTSWIGDESGLEIGVNYAYTLRPIGSIYNNSGVKSYVISGGKVEFNLCKLAPMNVKVNIYGVFEWSAVSNSQGFILDLQNTTTRYIQNDSGVGRTFESLYYGYNNYMFRALGSTSTITSGNLYYLSSRVNANENGILGSTLSSIDNVWIEDGLIKWTPLLNDNSNTVAGMTKVIGYRLTIDNGIGKIFTTDLTMEVYFTDIEGNCCFDFTNYGTENDYNISVQAFVYYKNDNTTETETATIYIADQNNNYYLLLGELIQIPFVKIAPPTDLSIINGEIVWSGVSSYSYIVKIFNEQNQEVYSELVDTEKWWSDTPLLSSDVNYKVKIKSYLDGCVFSVKTSYANIISGEDILFTKLDTLTVDFDTDNNGESNIISFACESQSFEVGFNIKYKTSIDGEYKYFDIYNPNYNNVITYLNNQVVIVVNNLENDLEKMYYSIQIVPLGQENYLKSNWSAETYYSTPAPIEQIYYDSENFVYYWIDSIYGYVLKDEILNSENEVVAIYYYKIANGNHTTENYYSVRTVMIDGVLTNIGTISYMPSVVGYKHQISVAVCLNPFAEKTLYSPYCQSEITTFNLFTIAGNKDLFGTNSGLYLENTQLGIENYLKTNAVGTAGNPYLVNNATDLANLNYRLTRYSYTYAYKVEYILNGTTEITANVNEQNTNYCFVQTQNISNINQFIGITKTISGDEIVYKGFGNTYDGQNFTITYSLLINTNAGKLGLFNVLESTGIIKNLNVVANIDFNANANASYIYGGLVGYNLGYIYNTNVLILNVSNLVDQNNNGLIGLTFGGIAGENAGTIELSVLNNLDLTIFLSSNGTNVYAGGIAGKNSGTILKCGNNANLSVLSVGKQPTIFVGGITGFNTGSILQSYNKGLIEETITISNSITYMGGIAGYNSKTGNIQNCYNVANIIGNTSTEGIVNRSVYFGGLVGYSESVNIKNCFSTMASVSTSGFAYSGTLVGYLSVAIPTATSSTQYNYYINENAIGYKPSGTVSSFATKLTASELQEYADELNVVATTTIFKSGTNYPKFVWEN